MKIFFEASSLPNSWMLAINAATSITGMLLV